MIDIQLLRSSPEEVIAALSRRGVDRAEVEALIESDALVRALSGQVDLLRAEVNTLSRRNASARRGGDSALADRLGAQSREVGEGLKALERDAEAARTAFRDLWLRLPNIPADGAPDGATSDQNVVVRSHPEELPAYGSHQRVPHWEIGAELGILDMERGAKLSGSMFPMYRGMGARLLRSLGAFALDRHSELYEEIHPPTMVRTETMISTGHLPKFADEAYHIERDDLWAIPTAEVPLTSMARDEILEEEDLPLRLTAQTACFRREAGAAGRDTRGLLRVHEFDKVELFAYTTEAQAAGELDQMVARASSLLESLCLPYRVLDLCAGDLGNSARRTFDLEVYSPGCDRWLEVSSVSWCGDYQARRAGIRYRPSGGGKPVVAHTLNGSALAWARIWAALVETNRLEDGSVLLPECLGPYLGGSLLISAPQDRRR